MRNCLEKKEESSPTAGKGGMKQTAPWIWTVKTLEMTFYLVSTMEHST